MNCLKKCTFLMIGLCVHFLKQESFIKWFWIVTSWCQCYASGASFLENEHSRISFTLWIKQWNKCLLYLGCIFHVPVLCVTINNSIKKFYILPTECQHSAHGMYFCNCYGPRNTQQLFSYTALTVFIFVIKTECVYWAVQTEHLNIIQVTFRL